MEYTIGWPPMSGAWSSGAPERAKWLEATENLALFSTTAAAAKALCSRPMILAATKTGVLAAELEARGFLAGVGKTILIFIVILVVIGALVGFSLAKRFGRRK